MATPTIQGIRYNLTPDADPETINMINRTPTETDPNRRPWPIPPQADMSIAVGNGGTPYSTSTNANAFSNVSANIGRVPSVHPVAPKYFQMPSAVDTDLISMAMTPAQKADVSRRALDSVQRKPAGATQTEAVSSKGIYLIDPITGERILRPKGGPTGAFPRSELPDAFTPSVTDSNGITVRGEDNILRAAGIDRPNATYGGVRDISPQVNDPYAATKMQESIQRNFLAPRFIRPRKPFDVAAENALAVARANAARDVDLQAQKGKDALALAGQQGKNAVEVTRAGTYEPKVIPGPDGTAFGVDATKRGSWSHPAPINRTTQGDARSYVATLNSYEGEIKKHQDALDAYQLAHPKDADPKMMDALKRHVDSAETARNNYRDIHGKAGITAQSAAAQPVSVQSQEEYDALPDGTPVIDANGVQGVKGRKNTA